MTLVEKEPSLVFYRNYDLYGTEGVSGPAKQSPGTGMYQNMEKYKSVADFRRKRRKKKIKKRQAQLIRMFEVLAKHDSNNLTDPYEETATPIPFAPAEPAQMGMLDGIYPKSDLEDKPVGNLGYGILETHLVDDEEQEEELADDKE
jgi:hypothetical protein